MAKVKIDRRVRVSASATVLSDAMVRQVGVNHTVWKIAKTPEFAEGLTPKEREWLLKQHEELTRIQQNISKLANRMRQTPS